MPDSTAPNATWDANIGRPERIGAVVPGSQASEASWHFSSGMKIFHLRQDRVIPLTAIGFVPLPPDSPLPGFVCQAARGLLNVSQAWLWERARVSRKKFVFGEDVVGVVVYLSRSDAAQRSRSGKHREP